MTARESVLADQAMQFEQMNTIFKHQKNDFEVCGYPDIALRKDRLLRLKQLLLEHKDELAEAINQDFGGRSQDETYLFDIMMPVQYINYCIKHLRMWMKPSKRHLGLHMQPGSAKVAYQPLGVVGIVGAWNYPIFLAAGPLIPALAAGNRAMIKMSEYAPKTGELFETLVSQYFNTKEVAVVNGDGTSGAYFSSLAFDHLIFTGSSAIGKHVMAAAAKNLTPVTLELGGKSPVIVSGSADIKMAAARVCHGKTANGGQTCVAPDYVLILKEHKDAFLEAVQASYKKMYPTLIGNKDCTAIVNERHFNRLKGMIDDAESKGAELTVCGSQGDSGSRRLPLHILTGVSEDMSIMQEEIFGPLLPIVEVDSFADAVAVIKKGERPLALYYFGSNADEKRFVENNLHAGGVTINNCMFHAALDDAPFGGVGASGMGQYHGEEGFKTFSNAKTILTNGKVSGSWMLAPPFGKRLHQVIYKALIR